MVPTKTRYVAEGHSNRACAPGRRRKVREHCGHLHLTKVAAQKCADKRRRSETRPWVWHVETIVFFLFQKRAA